jgi:hypothetical protein
VSHARVAMISEFPKKTNVNCSYDGTTRWRQSDRWNYAWFAVCGFDGWFVSEVTPLLWLVREYCVMPVVSRARF